MGLVAINLQSLLPALAKHQKVSKQLDSELKN